METCCHRKRTSSSAADVALRSRERIQERTHRERNSWLWLPLPTAVAYVEATVSALARYITEKCVVLDALRSEVGVCSTLV